MVQVANKSIELSSISHIKSTNPESIQFHKVWGECGVQQAIIQNACIVIVKNNFSQYLQLLQKYLKKKPIHHFDFESFIVSGNPVYFTIVGASLL